MHQKDLHLPPTNRNTISYWNLDAIHSRDRLFLDKVERIIVEHLSDPSFHVPALAIQLELSVSQLNRRLNALINHPAGALIRDLRLQFAAGLLAKDAASIKKISEMSGYKNQAHFCRSFKKRYGCPPSEFSLHKNRKLKEDARK